MSYIKQLCTYFTDLRNVNISVCPLQIFFKEISSSCLYTLPCPVVTAIPKLVNILPMFLYFYHIWISMHSSFKNLDVVTVYISLAACFFFFQYYIWIWNLDCTPNINNLSVSPIFLFFFLSYIRCVLSDHISIV